jgi:hypothetical protein
MYAQVSPTGLPVQELMPMDLQRPSRGASDAQSLWSDGYDPGTDLQHGLPLRKGGLADMDTSADRTNPSAMLARMPLERRIALKSWLKRWHNNQWMKDQDDWLEDACLIASSASTMLNSKRVLYCRKHGFSCLLPYFCRRCNLDQRVEPALYEYGESFLHAPYWYAAVLSTKVRADQASLRFGDFNDQLYPDAPDGFPLRTDWAASFQRLCRALFDCVRILNRIGVIGGAFCQLEFHLSIWPDDIGPRLNNPSGLVHSLHPHLNVLINTPIPLTPPLATGMYHLLDRNLIHHRAQLASISTVIESTNILEDLG